MHTCHMPRSHELSGAEACGQDLSVRNLTKDTDAIARLICHKNDLLKCGSADRLRFFDVLIEYQASAKVSFAYSHAAGGVNLLLKLVVDAVDMFCRR